MTLFIEGLVTEILEIYEHLAGISEEKEKNNVYKMAAK